MSDRFEVHQWHSDFYKGDGSPTMQFKGRMPSDIVAEMLKAFETVKDLPPVPHHFVARYDVPPGNVYRYWDTKGRLIVYVNRAAIEALPKRRYGGAVEVYVQRLDHRLGIPVIMEEVG